MTRNCLVPTLFIAAMVCIASCSKEPAKPVDYTSQVSGKYQSNTDSTKLTVNVTGMNQLEFIFELTDSNGVQTWDFDRVNLGSDLSFLQPTHDYGMIWTNFTGEIFPFTSTCTGIFRDVRVHFQSHWITFEGRKY